MPSDYGWFRFYTETIYDRKIRRLNPAQRWLWVTVLTIARTSPSPGKLLLSEGVPVTLEDLEDAANIHMRDVKAGMDQFCKQNMVHLDDEVFVVTHWDERQFSSDTSTERVKRHRERKRNGAETLHETFHEPQRNVPVTPPDTDTETETDIKTQSSYACVSDPRVSEIAQSYEQVFGRVVNPEQVHQLCTYLDEGLDAGLVVRAMTTARVQGKSLDYAHGILRNYRDRGIFTQEAAAAAEADWEERKRARTQGGVRERGHPSDGDRERDREEFRRQFSL